LFEQGKANLEAHRYAEACSQLGESERIEPAVGTLGLLAACHEKLGHLATAYREYLQSAERASAVGDTREGYARARAQELRARVPVLAVRSRTMEPGLVATLDGEGIELARPLLVNPGVHRIFATATKRRPWETELTLAEGASAEVVVPALSPEGPAPPAPVSSPKKADERSSVPPPAAWVTLGVGVVAIGVGAVTGVLAVAKREDLEGACGAELECREPAWSDVDSYNRLRVATTAALTAGGVIAAAGIVLLVVSGPSRRTSVSWRGPAAARMARPRIGAVSF
jgi:hypothetical protein